MSAGWQALAGHPGWRKVEEGGAVAASGAVVAGHVRLFSTDEEKEDKLRKASDLFGSIMSRVGADIRKKKAVDDGHEGGGS